MVANFIYQLNMHVQKLTNVDLSPNFLLLLHNHRGHRVMAMVYIRES